MFDINQVGFFYIVVLFKFKEKYFEKFKSWLICLPFFFSELSLDMKGLFGVLIFMENYLQLVQLIEQWVTITYTTHYFNYVYFALFYVINFIWISILRNGMDLCIETRFIIFSYSYVCEVSLLLTLLELKSVWNFGLKHLVNLLTRSYIFTIENKLITVAFDIWFLLRSSKVNYNLFGWIFFANLLGLLK